MLGVLLSVIFAVLSIRDFLWIDHIDVPPAWSAVMLRAAAAK
jgi:hypothetical protein